MVGQQVLNRTRTGIGSSLALLGLLAASCAPATDDTAGAGGSPTFEKVSLEAFRYPEPVASVSDLVPPTSEDAPWRVVGSLLDPGTGRTQGVVWQSEDARSWESAEIEPADRGVSEQLRAAAPFGDGLLAAGSVGQGEDADAVMWRTSGSDDRWAQVAPPAMGGRHEQWAFDVAVGDAGVVVVGGERAWGEVRPRVWHSTDGEQWQPVDGGSEGPFDQSGQESVSAVTAYGDGFVAVGWERSGGEQNGLAWYSPDGVSWEVVDSAPLGGEGRQALLSVTATDDVVVAGGYTVDGDGQGRPTVWRSTDGREWGGASDPLELTESRLSTASDLAVRSLSVHEGNLLATGGARPRPQVWRSSDGGRTWSPLAQLSPSRFPDGVDLIGAATDGTETVAVGAEPMVLRLNDETWSNTTGDAFPNGGSKPVATTVLVDGDMTLVGGYHLEAPQNNEPQRYQARVWRREGGGDFTVIGPVTEDEAAEGSEATEGQEGEGGEGEQAEDEAAPDRVSDEARVQGFYAGAIEAIAPFQDGYIAVGTEDFSVADQRSLDDPSPNGMLWVSKDGELWQRYAAAPADVDLEQWAEALTGGGMLDSHSSEDIAAAFIQAQARDPWITYPPAGGDGTRSLRGVTALGDGFLAVGSAFANGDINPIVARSGPIEDNQISGENPDFAAEATQRFEDVCSFEDRTVAVGYSGSDGLYDAAIYQREPGKWRAAEATDGSFSSNGDQRAVACAASEEGFIAVGYDDSSGSLNAKAWVSPNGLEWEEVQGGLLGGSGDQHATAVAPVPDGGWLIAGTDTATAGVALWRLLPNGQLSRRDLGEPALGGPAPMIAADLTITPDRTVIVGADVDGIGVWESKTSDLDR